MLKYRKHLDFGMNWSTPVICLIIDFMKWKHYLFELEKEMKIKPYIKYVIYQVIIDIVVSYNVVLCLHLHMMITLQLLIE